MAYPQHLAFQANWNLPGGEKASCTFRYGAINPTITPTNMQTLADLARARIATWTGVSGAYFSTAVALTTVKAFYYSPAGVVLQTGESASAGPTAGTGTPVLPNQCAVVVSLITPTAGRSYRGRVYLPLLAAPLVGASGRLSGAAGASILTPMRTALQGIAADILGASAVSATYLGVASVTQSLITPISALRCGDVIDTQRRRTDTMLETYTVSAGGVVAP